MLNEKNIGTDKALIAINTSKLKDWTILKPISFLALK